MGWIEILQALLTPTIFVIGTLIAFLQWRTNDLRRKNELFDRRYEFYQRFRKWWLAWRESEHYVPEIEDLIPFAEEADFLFGSDVSEYILSLAGTKHTGSPWFPNKDFISSFYEYLKLR